MSGPEHPASGGAEERVDLTGLTRLSDRPPPPKGERAIRVARGLSVLLLAIAAAGLPWYFVSRGGTKTDVKASPTPSRSSSPSAPASPRPGTYEVFNVGTVCLRIRAEPSTTARIIRCAKAGAKLNSDGQTRTAENRLWRRVYVSSAKAWGWAADEYLKRPA